MTKSLKNKIFFFAFVAVWILLVVMNIFSPIEDFSEAENRYLQKFPDFSIQTLLDGDYMDDVNTWLNDHFVGRSMWVSGQTLIEYGLGKREVNSVYLTKKALTGNVAKPDDQFTSQNIKGILDFQQRTQVPAYVMIIPSSTEIQPQNLPRFAESWGEKQYIDEVYSDISSSVEVIDMYSTFEQHSSEKIYFNTDHHWTSYGAALAYGRLAEALDITPRAPEDFSITTVSEDFLGTFHSKTGFPLVEKEQMQLYTSGKDTSYEVYDGTETKTYDSIYFDEYLDKKDKYSYFMGAVQPVVTIKTEADNGRKLLMFKDSYSHCLVPMMLSEYSEITLVDLRYVNPTNLADIVDAKGFDQMLFIYSVDVFSHQVGTAKLLQVAVD